MLSLHVFLSDVDNIENMVHHIFEQLLRDTKGQSLFNDIKQLFGKYIKEIGLFGISLSFNPSEKDLKEVTRNFPLAIYELLKRIKNKKNGIFIILDDINGLAEKKEFANWYKSFVDTITTHYKDFPVFIMILGTPDKRDKFADLQPSLMRIFRIIDIEKLSDVEVKEFFVKAFKKVNISINKKPLETITKYSSGLPILMQEIGDAIFWVNNDKTIDDNDALLGLINAAKNIGLKYLEPKVYNAIRSPRYISILNKLGRDIKRNFTKKEIEKKLNDNEKKVFHHFLRKMRERGVIEIDKEKARGAYKFVNEIYPIYIYGLLVMN